MLSIQAVRGLPSLSAPGIVPRGGQMGQLPIGAAGEGRKQLDQRYFMTNRHKNEDDKVFRMSQKSIVATNCRYFANLFRHWLLHCYIFIILSGPSAPSWGWAQGLGIGGIRGALHCF